FSTLDIGSPGRFFLAGDYNTNVSVDAADYVLWRMTLGSTTDLRADGSGPTTGVPNGVVDQFDYTYWRSDFGSLGALSGAGSGTGENSVEAIASGWNATVQTTSTQATQPSASNNATYMEIAIGDTQSLASSAATKRDPRPSL